jgi:predicted NAD-dependent protein-ADP-ribosyltransferase YbiA (DUF1768 family)
MKKYFILFLITSCVNVAAGQQQNPPPHTPPYPATWWTPVSPKGAPSWEILPQAAGYGEVILSKRNELGLLSNFAATPFVFHNHRYASVEGFWQATKYPEDDKDPRAHVTGLAWPHTRAEVEKQVSFQAKDSGNFGNQVMKELGVNWVTFEKAKMVYMGAGESPFYKLIVEVMRAKLEQNPEVKKVLIQTGDLKLRPDHHDNEGGDLKAWKYYDIWMMLRGELITH